MHKRIAATLLVTTALALPAATATAATPGTGSASGSANGLNNLLCELRSFLGQGCVYQLP
ncbi:hypothetical protein [Nocardia aurantia]|uniref:Uncharacterized protein n=1 Tax=Nocardia aurantia TaxID=2585199 RepID=A0A7K0DM20_9NOCA|nr:hypothetical protein [Nocardia aurantia]MQY26813.1 hypothetical protein [Nocardia aurantia]